MRNVLLALAVLAAPLANAQAEESEQLARRLVLRSGLSVQVHGFASQVEADLRQNPAGLELKLVEALAASAREAFQPEAMQRDIANRLAQKLTAADMTLAAAWLESSPGRRLTEAEELGTTSFDLPGFRAYAERLKSKPLSPRRSKLLAELIEATNAVNALAALQEALTLGVALSMDSLQPQELRAGAAALSRQLRALMPPQKLQAALAHHLPVLYAYTYREIAQAELEAYVGFAKTPAGRRYHEAMNAAFFEGLGRASAKLGEPAAPRERRVAM